MRVMVFGPKKAKTQQQQEKQEGPKSPWSLT